MKARTPYVMAGALLATACVGPRPAKTVAMPSPDSAAEQARREERLKLMQRYWLDRTEGALAGVGSALPVPPEPLFYPAGQYDGLLFSSRVAIGPGLDEPVR